MLWSDHGIEEICHWSIFRIFQINRQCICRVDYLYFSWDKDVEKFYFVWTGMHTS